MQGVRFDPKPSQDGEKDIKRRKKVGKKMVVGARFEFTDPALNLLGLNCKVP